VKNKKLEFCSKFKIANTEIWDATKFLTDVVFLEVFSQKRNFPQNVKVLSIN
jgi:hypothetical protein